MDSDYSIQPSAAMSDFGTRMDHLDNLRSLWKTALEALEQRRPEWSNERDKSLMIKLQGALELLDDHMAKDYTPWKMAKEINGLPPADKIEGGRGTPIRKAKGK